MISRSSTTSDMNVAGIRVASLVIANDKNLQMCL